jgi:hypothetical protein
MRKLVPRVVEMRETSKALETGYLVISGRYRREDYRQACFEIKRPHVVVRFHENGRTASVAMDMFPTGCTFSPATFEEVERLLFGATARGGVVGLSVDGVFSEDVPAERAESLAAELFQVGLRCRDEGFVWTEDPPEGRTWVVQS